MRQKQTYRQKMNEERERIIKMSRYVKRLGFRNCFDERYSCKNCNHLINMYQSKGCNKNQFVPIDSQNYERKTCDNWKKLISIN